MDEMQICHADAQIRRDYVVFPKPATVSYTHLDVYKRQILRFVDQRLWMLNSGTDCKRLGMHGHTARMQQPVGIPGAVSNG